MFRLLMDSNLYYPRLGQSDCGICGYVRQKRHVPYLAVSLTAAVASGISAAVTSLASVQ